MSPVLRLLAALIRAASRVSYVRVPECKAMLDRVRDFTAAHASALGPSVLRLLRQALRGRDTLAATRTAVAACLTGVAASVARASARLLDEAPAREEGQRAVAAVAHVVCDSVAHGTSDVASVMARVLETPAVVTAINAAPTAASRLRAYMAEASSSHWNVDVRATCARLMRHLPSPKPRKGGAGRCVRGSPEPPASPSTPAAGRGVLSAATFGTSPPSPPESPLRARLRPWPPSRTAGGHMLLPRPLPLQSPRPLPPSPPASAGAGAGGREPKRGSSVGLETGRGTGADARPLLHPQPVALQEGRVGSDAHLVAVAVGGSATCDRG